MIEEIPGEIPETIPVEETVATEVLLLLQTPPVAVSESVTALPEQMVVAPLIGFTVTIGITCIKCL
jgi:hypothetical protein